MRSESLLCARACIGREQSQCCRSARAWISSEEYGIVYYASDEIRGFFADFFSRGEWKQYEIEGYIWNEATQKTHAMIVKKATQEVSEWAMDVTTRIPYVVAKPSWGPDGPRNRRPRKPGSAIWRATKAWENR